MNNTGFTGPLRHRNAGPVADLEAYDSLPATVRRLLVDQPVNWSAVQVAEHLAGARRRGMGIREFVAFKRAGFASSARTALLACYGPDHPAA